MFGSPDVSVTYNARLRRVRIHFLASECFKSRKPPGKLIKKIEDRLAEAKEDGFIETFDIFTKRLDDFWAHIRSLEGKIDENREIKFTVAQGGRIYPEIILKPGGEDAIALLSCQFSRSKMSGISFNTFVFNVMLQLKKLHVERNPDRAQLRFLYLLLKHGHALRDETLRAQPRPQDYVRLSRLVSIDPRHHFVSLHVFDERWLESEASCKRLLHESLVELKELNKDKRRLVLLNKHSLEKLQSLVHKMQALGFQMPYDLLIAYDVRHKLDAGLLRQEKQLAKHDQEAQPRWKVRLGVLQRRPRGDYFQVETEDSGMRAVIRSVEKSALAAVKDKIDLESLARELEKQGIVFGYEGYLEDLWQAIHEGRDLVGMDVAEGTPAQAGQVPVLYMFQRAENGEVDIREAQNQKLYKAGDRVAEIRFEDGAPGTTVEGKPVHARMPAAHAPFRAGEGIILKEDDRFYAERDGLVAMEGQTISCESIYVHKGSINLASGNLNFDGAVVVEGDIEAGASVQVRGRLSVKGMIAAAKVRCSGDVEVQGGIITGDHGYLQVGGNLTCSYIENSHIQVKKNLTVARSIMNSSVIGGASILVTDSNRGLIAGGSVSAWSAIRVARCGLPQGQVTECRIGSDYLMERRILHLAKRKLRIQDYCRMIEATIATIEGSKSQKPETKDEIRTLQDRAKRAHAIVQALIQKQDHIERRMNWNTQATLVVSGILEKNVALTAAGKTIPISNSLQAIFVPATPVNGSQIVDLEELDAFTKAHPEAMVA